jgi:hypothetical protein
VELLSFALLLLILLCVLLGTGLWIPMSLAVVGYIGMMAVHPQPGLFLASSMWESTG